jgi:hypothetical protein
MHLQVFVKLKKTLKPSRLGKKTQKNPKKPKKPKKTHWAGFFFFKNRVFSNPGSGSFYYQAKIVRKTLIPTIL